MKINKILMMTAAAALVTALTAKADDWWNDHFYYDSANTKQVFNANEFSVDAFGSYLTTERPVVGWGHSWDHGSWGGGLGLNYFFLQDLGVGVESSAQTDTQHFIDHVGGDLIARLPIQTAHLAPYVFGGGGRSFNPDWRWYLDGGAGLEFRLNPKLGLFTDGRYMWKDGKKNDQVLLRAGIRLAF